MESLETGGNRNEKRNVDNVENVLLQKHLTVRNTNKVNEKALYEETIIQTGCCNLY